MAGFPGAPEDERPAQHTRPRQVESTASLLARARSGDLEARDALLHRFLPALRRWAHGRLPNRARDLVDTDDLVQVSLLKALDHLKGFEPRHEGAFLAYLRRILLNRIREEIRRTGNRPGKEALAEDLPGRDPSPLEELIGRETLEAYEAALAKLPETQRAAVVLRLELQYTHEQVAQAIGSSSANAARMVVKRALLRMAEVMEHAQRQG